MDPQDTFAAEPTGTGRKVVLCFDGTGDWLGNDETNVAKIYAALSPEVLAFYDGGVGTLTDPRALTFPQRIALKLIDLASGTSLREKVLAGYGFLVEQYRPGDRIFLFGFSRGAYTARLVAAMVGHFGLLRPQAAHLAPYLWQTLSGSIKEEALEQVASRLRDRFARPEPIEIELMGLFDTVTSVGLISRFKRHPGADGTPATKRVLHAVSIEEERNMFPEALMRPEAVDLTEVWFPGVHRDSGGGLSPERSRIADEALFWIAAEAQEQAQLFRPELLERFRPDRTCPAVPNYPPFDPYVFFGILPIRRFSQRMKGSKITWPNWRHYRRIPENALIHRVAKEIIGREGESARPVNLPKNPIWFDPESEEGPFIRNAAYVAREVRPGVVDATGIAMGVALLFLIWNMAVGSPFGDSWPRAWGFWTTVLGLTFVGLQGLGQSVTMRLPHRFRPNAAGSAFLPWVGLALLALLIAFVPGWTLLKAGAAGGAVAWLVAQVGPWPVMRYERTLPYFLFAGLISGLFLRVLDRIVDGSGTPPIAASAALVAITVAALALVARERFRMARNPREANARWELHRTDLTDTRTDEPPETQQIRPSE